MVSYTEYKVKITTWNTEPDSEDYDETHVKEKYFDSHAQAYNYADFSDEVFQNAIRQGRKFHYSIYIQTVEYTTNLYSSGES